MSLFEAEHVGVERQGCPLVVNEQARQGNLHCSVLSDWPSSGDLGEWPGIEVVELGASAPLGHNQASRFEHLGLIVVFSAPPSGDTGYGERNKGFLNHRR
jgi:hypothetical protein